MLYRLAEAACIVIGGAYLLYAVTLYVMLDSADEDESDA